MNKFASSSLSFPTCADDIRFEFDGKTLNVVTRKDSSEKHSFHIVSETQETINDIVHTVLTSNQGDTFYIVNNQFHREGDGYAINMRRWIVDYDHSKPHTLNTWAKIWMKNGLYHRSDDCPALIFQNGDLLWMENGHFKRNPFTNASIYIPNCSYLTAVCFDRENGTWDYPSNKEIKKQKAQKLFDFKYETA